MRNDGRTNGELRKISFETQFTDVPYASVLVRFGKTVVWVAASVDESQPPWMTYDKKYEKKGWVTAEYSMMPGSTSPRSPREGRGKSLSGRTQEIQRLIGRSLRAITKLEELGPRTITLDCDVLQADGGTRTASISGAYVALAVTLHRLKAQKLIRTIPLTDSVAAVSCGIVKNEMLLDLNYREDTSADVDMNVVLTGQGRFVEVQGSGEESTFDQEQLNGLLSMASEGIKTINQLQLTTIEEALNSLKI